MWFGLRGQTRICEFSATRSNGEWYRSEETSSLRIACRVVDGFPQSPGFGGCLKSFERVV